MNTTTKKASRLNLDEVIVMGRKEIKVTDLRFISGGTFDTVTVSGIDLKKGYYVKTFILQGNDKLQVVA
jgi:hypothetical protein